MRPRDIRRALLRDPGVSLLGTKTRRARGERQRADLLSYRVVGEPAGCYIVAIWQGEVWTADPFYTHAEALAHFEAWGVWTLPLPAAMEVDHADA